MAADLERTMIAARHSSRDLAKLLRGLFLEEHQEPLVVVDEAPAAPVAAPMTGPATGSMASIRSSTQEISNTDRTRSSRTNIASVALDGALRAEQGRLRSERMKGQARVAFVLVALVAGAVGGLKAWPHVAPLVHELLASAPAQPPPAGPPMPATMDPPPAPPTVEAKPAPRKKTGGKKAKPDVGRTGVADDVMRPSD
jgi:hypothetical protein